MSLDYQNKLFKEKYLSKTDNLFEADNMYIDDANKLYNQHEGLLSNSECLKSSLIEKLPADLYDRIPVKHSELNYTNLYVKEILNQVDDKYVKQSVYLSIKRSIYEKCLSFVYVKNMTESQQSRTRVVCRLIWYNLCLNDKNRSK